MRHQLIRSTAAAVAIAVLITMLPVAAAVWRAAATGHGIVADWISQGATAGQSLQLAGILVALAVVALAAGVLGAARQADRAERLGAGESRIKPLHSGIAELDQVSQVLARSAQSLTRTMAAERDFASDASHQLRTPLTALLMRLEEIAVTDDLEVVQEE